MPTLNRSSAVVLLAGMVLFLSVGIRQGFGLFLVPVIESNSLSMATFSLSVAIQYLLWGGISPIAAKFANKYGNETILATGGCLYMLGFLGASISTSATEFVVCVGVFIGLGLGFANYGVVNELVSKSVKSSQRGHALGVVGSITALGQLLCLLFTSWTLAIFEDWRTAFVLHGVLVTCIIPISFALKKVHNKNDTISRLLGSASMSLGSRWDLILICIGFGLSGLQVMFTMTHLPTLIALNGFSSTSGTWLLVILSGSSFLGSYVAGHLCDEIEHRRLLAWIYLARAVLAALFLVLPGDFWSLTSYFFLLGLVWMSTFPLVTGLIAELFGVHKLAVIFGYVFLSHQIGGFIGTWIGGIIAEQTGSYSSMFPLMCGGCLLAAALTTRISKRDSLAIN